MSDVPRLLQKERIHEKNRGEPRFKPLMLARQRNYAWMKGIVKKVLKPGSFVVGAYGASHFVDKGGELLPERGRFMECKVTSTCVTEEMPQLILLFVG